MRILRSGGSGGTASKPLEGVKIFFCGDSITAGTNATKPYHQWVAEETGATVKFNGSGGSGYWTGDPLYNRYTEFVWQRDSADADIIILFMGTNDWRYPDPFNLGALGDTTVSTFYGAVDDAFSKLVAKYPFKKVGVITPLPSVNAWNNAHGELKQISDALIDVSGKYSFPSLDLYRSSNLHVSDTSFISTYMEDGLHINDLGHKLITPPITSFVLSI
jgi:lysophospholipase L1-like esterase